MVSVNLRTSTVAGICFFLAGVMFVWPIALFDVEFDDIDNELMAWECATPITNINQPDVILDDIRADLADLPDGEKLTATHPGCRALARTQVALGLIAIAAGLWQASIWWRSTADDRAEKKFKRLQEQTTGKSKGMLG